ncbi:unnamed protein product [Mucor circinelloides]|uniref:Arrestin C-terminal-like domain-containing protein n=1 Tax=Mucor circinelloides f. circinelloides (strain 1006PhL) TaxID=1220926 RepID=S2KEG7_MUCC1|nr:hypothetical protein HMPREF1544_02333 [Mucor circinelloides 1006PhL]
MKDDFKSLEIEPKEGYLDFIGPAKLHSTAQSKVLKGHVKFTLIRPTKIRTMSVKFKGFSNITLKQPYNIETTCPLLPKLKVPLFGRVTLPAGDHVIPWELDIPNIYPRSLLAKRATIHYKVIVSISTGIARTLTAEYPVVLKRHLLPYKELSPLIETKLYQRTVPGKFHYEIDAPQIVCIEQEYIPMAIKYVSIANQKPVQSIRTRIVQIELYRRQSLSKSESDLTASNRDSHIFDLDKKIADSAQYKDTHIKYIKRTIPALIHIPDTSTSAWKRPCLIRHNLHPYLSYTLDSPLVSIYHQIEITFQFGMKYEEVKTKLPIIIASIPSKGSAQTQLDKKSSNLMMKYAFEETARSEFLLYKLESRDSTCRITDDGFSSQNDDSFSVLRDTSMMPITSDEEDDERDRAMGGRTTPMMFVTGNPSRSRSPVATQPHLPSAVNTYMTNTSNIFNRRVLSPTPESSSTLDISNNQRQLKKFASAFDLSTASEESLHLDAERQPEERPRTTTPTMKRSHMQRKQLQPINVDLANGKEVNLFKSMPSLRPPPQTTLPPPPVSQESANSDVLPTLDRMQHQQQMRKNMRQPHPPFESATTTAMDNTSNDDLQSIYSESSISSSHNAPSLSSSATLSTNKSQPTLHSRPPSPVFSPAPGLPATIALRPHGEGVQAVEEMFPPDSASIMSPAMNTVASSTLFSPRTTYALQRRIALSTISSLTNDSLQLGPSMLSPNNMRGRTSSTVDPDVQSLMHSSFCSSSLSSFDYPPPPPNNRYAYAQLPPIPTNVASPPPLPPLPTAATNADNTAVKANRRLTRLYIDDSDEEDYIDREDGVRSPSPPPLPQIPTNIKSYTATHNSNSNISNESEIKDESLTPQDDCAPPRLPRLSFGNDFGISLGI